MNKKIITSGLLAGLIAGSGAGLILQSTGFAGASNTAAVVVEDTTGTTGTTGTDSTTDSTDARPDRAARLTEVLQPLVDDGTITAEQLTAVVAALDAAGPLGGGRGGPGGPDGGMRGPGIGLDTAAEVLGITEDALRTELEAGQTLAEIATAQGVEVQSVIDALVTAAGTHLAEHVAAGDLTQEQADAKLADATERITDMVNNGGDLGRGGHGGPRDGGRGDHGDDGDDDGPDAAAGADDAAA